MRLIALAVALSLPVAAQADVRTVSWFMAHPSNLRQTLAACHDNNELANTSTCANAEAASAGLRSRGNRSAVDQLAAMLRDPAYWTANPIARGGALAQCQSGTAPYPAACPSIYASALQAQRFTR